MTMAPKIKILKNLHERLRLLKSTTTGTLYGMEGSDCLTLVTCIVDTSAAPHCPSALLPAPLKPLASLRQDTTRLAYTIEVDNREVLVSTRGGRELSYDVVSQQEWESVVCVARVGLELGLEGGEGALEKLEEVSFVHNESGRVLKVATENEDDGKCVKDLLDVTPQAGYSSVLDVAFTLWLGGSSSLERSSEKEESSRVSGELVAYLERSLPLSKVGAVLQRGLGGLVSQVHYWNSTESAKDLRTLTVLPYRLGHVMSLVCPKGSDEDREDYRKGVNASLLLPTTAPFFSRMNAFEFSSDKVDYRLYNPHEGLKNPAPDSLVAVVRGVYSYHHYMQDKFDDGNWGCAYRSLQTIASWFRHQGYTASPAPSHRQIQDALVAIGDKPPAFAGSKDWIGSLEVGFVLEHLFGVTSKVLSVERGDEMYEIGRQLLDHFTVQGTPVMIGGGVLAHTILGVTYDPDSGDTHYLVLDPHYTGTEDVAVVQRKGWCGWKAGSFWNKKAFYNLCLPQRPVRV